jgi:hypothetical protein
LTDSWTFERGQTWEGDLVGHTAHQGAPACIARNIELPRVTSTGDKPFVFASRFANGAVAIGVQERTCPGRAWYMPPANVELHVENASGPFGIFGNCRMLTLVFHQPLTGNRVLAQDLATDEALDVTDRVRVDGRRLQLTEANLRSFGLRAVSKGDVSSPGLVLALR